MNLFFRKSLIALTGLFLCIFLVVHLSANCILLLPEDHSQLLYNAYSKLLRENPFIQIVAYALYLSIVLHVIYALLVTLRNKSAKPDKYVINDTKANSYWVSQNMGLLGIFILLFLIVHLSNFWARLKLGMGESVGLDAAGNIDVYSVTNSLFHNGYFVIFYSLLMLPLGFHLHHGLNSAFKTLGFYHRKGLKLLAKISTIYAAFMSVGFGIIPIVVYFR